MKTKPKELANVDYKIYSINYDDKQLYLTQYNNKDVITIGTKGFNDNQEEIIRGLMKLEEIIKKSISQLKV